MKRMKILILGFAAISAASLCSAYQAPPAAVPIEKVVSFDVVPAAPALELAVCDFDAALPCVIERNATTYAVRQPSIAGRSASTKAKVSAQARTCGGACRCSLRSAATDYEQRM